MPDLPLRAALRSQPELAGEPLAIATGREGRAQIVAVSPSLARMGLAPGRSLAHARAVCSGLQVRTSSPDLEKSAREALLDAALSLSPRALLAPTRADGFASEAAVWLDAAGVEPLFGSETRFASMLAVRCEAVGLPAVVAIASTRAVALLAARKRSAARQANEDDAPPLVIAPGAERRFVEALPIDWLEAPDALAQQLTRLGVYRVRDLLRLPRRTLSHRLGPEALALMQRARGERHEEPLPEPEAHGLEESVELEYPVGRLDALLFALRGPISRLGERLSLRGLACDALDLRLELEGGGSDARRLGSATPTTDVRVWLRLASLAFEARPPHAPIERGVVRAEARPARSDQLDLFRPAGPDPRELGRTIAELESLCGADGVGAPALANDHRPGRHALRPFGLARAEREGSARRARTAAPPAPLAVRECSLAVRALRPPAAAEVHVQRGLPARLRSAVASGEVIHVSGPWRTTGGWWSENDRHALDHYDVQTDDGTVLRLCFDWLTRRWQIDAIYD